MSATNKNHDVLIKRIDEYLRTTAGALAARAILRDCRAALSRTQRPVAVVSDEFSCDTHYIEVCEPGTRLELGTKLYLEPPLSQMEPVRYVPMTDAEWAETMREFNAPASGMNPYDADYGYHEERHIEAAVIRRAGLEVQE